MQMWKKKWNDFFTNRVFVQFIKCKGSRLFVSVSRQPDKGKYLVKGGSKMTVEEMKSVDIRTVDPDSLVDVKNLNIPEELTGKERLEAFVQQVRNPFCYRVGNVVVKNVYSQDGVTINDRFEQMLKNL